MTTDPRTGPAAPAPDTKPQGRPRQPSFVAHLAHRWPTWLAIAFAALLLADTDDSGREFALVLLIPTVTYLATSVVDRPRAVWAVLAVLVAAMVAMKVVGIDPRPVLTASAVVLAVAGLVRGPLRRPGLHALQVPAVLVFGAVALGALHLSPDTGVRLVAVGLIGHAVWDAAHLRAGKVVARPFAEWCAVLDVILGVGLLALA